MQATGIDERTVAVRWEQQAFEKSALKVLDMDVIFRGIPADAGGPDYQGVVLCVGGTRLIEGDAEFHVRTSDWNRHGHHRNPSYNRVILHVVWHDDGAVSLRADGVQVPVLEIGDAGWGNAVATQRTLFPHPCVTRLVRVQGSDIATRVRQAGYIRFKERAALFAGALAAQEPDQVAYTALLEGLGYASNRQAFRSLADAVPYAWLCSVPSAHWGATLLEAAGLGPPAHCPPPAHLHADIWRLTRIRPNNHPALRIEGAAIVLLRLGTQLSESLEDVVLHACRPSDVRAALQARNEQGDTYIGAGRADELVASFLLPFVAAITPNAGHVERLLGDHPSPPATRWTRTMETMLAEAGHRLRPIRALEHQGLHHVYHAHCRPQRTNGCPLCDGKR